MAWYDGTCPLCLREIGLMRRLDRAGRIEFVDAADPGSACPAERSMLLSRFHVMEKGSMLTGAAAFAAMWRAIPVLWPLGQVARIPLVLGLMERLYLRFLTIRPRLQVLFR